MGIWVVLGISIILDGALGDYAISPGGDVIYFDANGQWIAPKPSPAVWISITGFVLLQGVLILAQIRLRAPNQVQPSMFSQRSGTPAIEIQRLRLGRRRRAPSHHLARQRIQTVRNAIRLHVDQRVPLHVRVAGMHQRIVIFP